MSWRNMLRVQEVRLSIQNLHRAVRWSLLIYFCVGWLAACGGNVVQQSTSPPVVAASSPAESCRIVQHAMGEACVPSTPQRIVALSGFAVDAVFALDMKPVGAITNVANLWADEMKTVESLGLDDQVSLEKILTLQPDLILASQWNAEAIYDRLSAIAPTVIDDSILGDWKQSFALYAQALGKTERANQLMTEYQQRVRDVRAQMSDELQQTTISLVRIYPDGFGLYLKNSFAGGVLEEIGFPRPPSQNKGTIGQLPFQDVISKERIRDIDGDAMFVWTFGATPEIALTAKTALQQVQDDPLWLQLNAVQQGKVFEVSDYWHVASTPTQAMLVIDDLLKYLVNHEP
jgi:iron complex transport system substrate-binding protein